VRLVDVPLEGACSLWAPELSVLPRAAGGEGGGADGRGAEAVGGGAASGGVGAPTDTDGGGTFMVTFSATRHDGACPPNMCGLTQYIYIYIYM